jgi:hypothetical protein
VSLRLDYARPLLFGALAFVFISPWPTRQAPTTRRGFDDHETSEHDTQRSELGFTNRAQHVRHDVAINRSHREDLRAVTLRRCCARASRYS